MSHVRPGGVLAVAILVAGCHSFLPFGGPGDGSRESPGVVVDGPGLLDAGPDGGCDGDTPAVAAALAGCSACTDKPNCDGIPDYRDLSYFGACNRLLFEEVFPSTFGERWAPRSSPAGSWSWSCGKAVQGVGDDHRSTLVAGGLGLLLKTPDYLVEARVELGAITNPATWGVGVASRVVWPEGATQPLEHMVCDLARDERSGLGVPMLKPDPRVFVKTSSTPEISGWPPTNAQSPIKALTGEVYYLQLWFTSNILKYMPTLRGCSTAPSCPAVICRVCTELDCPRTGLYGAYQDGNAYIGYVPKSIGTVGVRAYGRRAKFDYVRVFGLTSP